MMNSVFNIKYVYPNIGAEVISCPQEIDAIFLRAPPTKFPASVMFEAYISASYKTIFVGVLYISAAFDMIGDIANLLSEI